MNRLKRNFLVLCFRSSRRLSCTWKFPSKTKDPAVPWRCQLGLPARCCAPSDWPMLWSFDSPDRRRQATIRICAQHRGDPGSLCSARLLNHRNYFQRQPEHAEDKFMHHNEKNEIACVELVPDFNINEKQIGHHIGLLPYFIRGNRNNNNVGDNNNTFLTLSLAMYFSLLSET